MEPSFHPLDFDALKKGTWIETEELIRILGSTPADRDKWKLGILRLCDQIEKNAKLVARADHDRVRVMDDRELCAWTYRWVEQLTSRQVNMTQRRSLIDRAELSDAERDLAERRDRVAIAVSVGAMATLRKQRRIEKLVHKPAGLLADGETEGSES